MDDIIENVADSSVVDVWKLKSKDGHTYDLTNNMHNTIMSLLYDIKEEYNLTDEEHDVLVKVTQLPVIKNNKR